MRIDIDRLHSVINGEEKQRGCGHTVAKLEQLIGFIELGTVSTILCKSRNMVESQRLKSILTNRAICLYQLGEWDTSFTFQLDLNEHLKFTNGVEVRFVSEDNMLKNLAGVSDYILLDFTKDFSNEDSSYC